MRKILVAIAFSLFLGCAATTNFQKNAERRFAGIVADDGIGSATWLGNGYFLTARHVLTSKNGEYVRFKVYFERSIDSLATIIIENGELVIFQTSIASKTSSPKFFTKKVKIGEELHWIQQFFGYGTMDYYFQYGRVARIEKDSIYVDKDVYSGGSGAGVYNSRGEFVGIVYGHQVYELGVSNDEKTFFGLIISVPRPIIDFLKKRK